MNEIIELLENYGPMTASEIASELNRSLSWVENTLATSEKISSKGFGTYALFQENT